jgi:hypothetical protein
MLLKTLHVFHNVSFDTENIQTFCYAYGKNNRKQIQTSELM